MAILGILGFVGMVIGAGGLYPAGLSLGGAYRGRGSGHGHGKLGSYGQRG